MKKHERREIDLHIGTQLRAARHFRGYSQQGLASEIDVSFQQLQKYERGVNRVSAGLLYDLSCILKVPLSYFYNGLPPAPEKAGFHQN